MRLVVLNLLFIFLPAFFMKAQSQEAVLDSLHHVLVTAPDDTVRMVTLDNLAGYYAESNRDSSMYFTEASIVIAKKMNQQLYLAGLLLTKSYLVQKQANFTLSLKLCNEALAILDDKRNEKGAYIPAEDEFANDLSKYRKGMKINVYHQLGNTNSGVGDKDKAIEYFKKEIGIAEIKFSGISKDQEFHIVLCYISSLDFHCFDRNKNLPVTSDSFGSLQRLDKGCSTTANSPRFLVHFVNDYRFLDHILLYSH